MISLVVDSSCWIEVLTEGKNAAKCEKAISRTKSILVPTLVIFEVYKKIAAKVGQSQSLLAVSYLSQNKVLELDRATALLAADISLELGLAMADSIVLAHARNESANLVTLDNDFANLEEVMVIR